MSNLIISELDDNLFQQYQQFSLEETEFLELEEEKPMDTRIIELIGDYNTLKLILIRQDHEKQLIELSYENELSILKKGYMEEGMKSTEAKEQANHDLKYIKTEIIHFDKQINLLKASIHSIEYQLRLKFIQMKQDITLKQREE